MLLLVIVIVIVNGNEEIATVEDYGPETYGDYIAEVYDTWYTSLEKDAVVQRIEALAGPGPVLELGIGTGRIALPVQERGIEVHGIDGSQAMVTKLREKPGGERIPVTIGDFADVAVDGEYSVIYIPFNTIFALLSQEAQLRCFQNVAQHLTEDGVFVFDAFVPDLTRFDRNQRVGMESHDPDAVRLETSIHDPLSQTVTSRHVVLSEKGAKFYPVKVRYAWPSELDLMARLAGLRLRERCGGWSGEPFTARSTSHVSIYERDRA
jgi:SAM-dependent methyltransferase